MTDVRVRGAYATVRGPGIDDEVAVEEPLEIRVDDTRARLALNVSEELALEALAYRLET